MLLPMFQTRSDTCVILGPGPSLSEEQIELVKEARPFTIAIGDAGRVMLPTADIMYHCERKYWQHYQGCKEFAGKYKVAMEDTAYVDIYQAPRSNLTTEFDYNFPYLVTGNNSGYQAINLAIHFRPKKLILIGYDMKDTEDGRHNVIGNHPKEIKRPSDFPKFINNIGTLVKPLEDLGIVVYNSTIDTALNCFKKLGLKDALGA